MLNTYIPPSIPCGTQYRIGEVLATFVVRWVQDGGRHDEGLQVPSFGCLTFFFYCAVVAFLFADHLHQQVIRIVRM